MDRISINMDYKIRFDSIFSFTIIITDDYINNGNNKSNKRTSQFANYFVY